MWLLWDRWCWQGHLLPITGHLRNQKTFQHSLSQHHCTEHLGQGYTYDILWYLLHCFAAHEEAIQCYPIPNKSRNQIVTSYFDELYFFRYHFGSLAFGSLIIAIIQMIRVALEYLDHKLKGSENRLAKFFLKYDILGFPLI